MFIIKLIFDNKIDKWGCSSNGRALALHARGTGFDPPHLHLCKLNKILCSFFRSISAHFQTSLFSASFSLFIFISLEEDVTKLKFFITLPPQTHQRMIQIFNLFEYNVKLLDTKVVGK